MSGAPDSNEPIVEVERLVAELRERAARRRAAGGHGDDLEAIQLEATSEDPSVRFRPELGYSTKPVVGPALTALKRLLFRLLFHPLDDLARQTNAGIERAVGEVRETRRWSEAAYEAEANAREEVQRALGELLARVESVEQVLDRLQLVPRLARLERSARQAVPAPARSLPVSEGAPPRAVRDAPPIDYLAFEARFRGSEEDIRARQTVYVEALRGRRRVVDLGCGRGELLQLLTEQGVSAYGVELNQDFVELVAEKGLEIVREDALEHLDGLGTGEVDAIVASHVVEHLSPQSVARLVAAAWERLPDGGLLIIETPNPESLVAGSVNFHRDPTHVRPVHPDTLAFICESTGFSSTEVRRLSRVPDAERLAARSPGDDPLARHLDRIVAQLNDLLYGYQDYAVLAWR